MTTEATIRSLITENVAGINGDKLKPHLPFLEAGLDSLDLATVFLEVQETFGVLIADGEEDLYDTLEKLVTYVDKNKG